MAYPSKLLNEGEHVVVTTRTHPKALIGPALVLVLLVAAVIWLSTLTDSTPVGVGAGIVAVLVVLWFVVRPLVAWLTTTYTFTNRRFIKRSGFIAKEGRTIPLNRISGVDFEIGVIDRIFGCGTLVVSDASTDGSVLLHDIPDVEQVQLQVANELHRLSGGDRRDDGA
ncbi:PH domain-containing protein [Nocardioides sp. S-58]|uniref:PH domain-containing protein n=1 Tax=Nocardioides renjunii TaxID=3095075 RepID=A0ABU5KD86_9ACTN|nr:MULTISPECIES: PH domain-containing protein [unclassified Nocardioides]MDZ5662828.1 PH domain-containing protein [Nocardioides sp. S-58]WQQ23389.1 PH domain-containing protein [Nocardioides sp. S-34]